MAMKFAAAGWFLFLLILSPVAAAAAPDAWAISMVWSPEFCKAHPESREPQCTENRYFELAGLSPDGHSGSSCVGGGLPRELVERAMFTVPNQDTVRRIWRDQGACSGLSAQEYLMQLDRARLRLSIPDSYRDIGEKRQKTTLAALKEAFASTNEGLEANQVAARCRGSWLYDVQICVDADFRFRSCGAEIADQCGEDILIRPARVSRSD